MIGTRCEPISKLKNMLWYTTEVDYKEILKVNRSKYFGPHLGSGTIVDLGPMPFV
jgi:hypothetical protein